jgi:hypothetical protein
MIHRAFDVVGTLALLCYIHVDEYGFSFRLVPHSGFCAVLDLFREGVGGQLGLSMTSLSQLRAPSLADFLWMP